MGLNRFSLPAVAVIMMINAMLLSQGCLEEERIALLQIKTSFGDHPNDIPSSLLSWGKDALCCSWEGVTCSNSTTRRVIEINLYFTRYWSLEDLYLNASIFLPFQELNVLDLSGNGIAGCVANEGFERLSRLAKLETLDLNLNNFNNSIISSLKGLSSLKHLYLGYNRLQGSIDTKEFDSLSNLEMLWLYENKIQEFVTLRGSEEPSRLDKLETLYLGHNNFNNSILSSLKGLSSLKYLYLDGNQLQGSINMKEFDSLSNLEVLSLTANEIQEFVALTGSEEPSRLDKLEFLDLDDNNFNNSILSSLKGLSSLKHLYLDHNQLQGSINMKEFDSLSNLEELWLAGNTIQDFVALTGSEEPSRLDKLETLYLGHNNFNNSILSSLKGLSSLKYLYLDGNQLQGSINMKEFDSLSNLEELWLAGNTIQDFVALTDSEEPSRLTKLEVLYLSSNYLNNSIISSLKGLSSLKYLYLDGNQLQGSINMKGLCELKHLQKLDISHNNLNGYLPWCLSNLTNLQVLDISFNDFTGNISLSPIGSLTSIQDLRLSHNHFKIPISLGPFFNLSKLKHLNGDHNEIYESTELVHNLIPRFQLQWLSLECTGSGGTFPKSLYYQHDLQFVDLSHIKMTGEFPSWLLQNNTKLEGLYLVNNSLSGSFQLANHSLVRLSHLDISRNRIHNQIPTEIGACFPRLVFLNLSRNDFDGSIPSSISNMSLLKVLDLSNNNLSGNIPEQLVEGCLSLEVIMLSNNYFEGQLFWKNFNLTYLTELILRGNQLTGILPNSLSSCSALEALDVSNNNLSGKVPRWIGNMSSLEYLDLSENNLFGSLPSSFCSSRMMTEVYLSKNKLEGSLIDAFDGCMSLNRLDLSHNYFRGKIPESIGSLFQLSFLLLGYNNLEGEIPSQLCKLEKLSLIDLSHNNLCGHILSCLQPSSKWYREREASINPSDSAPGPIMPFAAAPIPLEDPSVNKAFEFTTKSRSYSFKGIILTYFSGIDLSCNNLTGEIPFELGYLGNIQVLNLSHNSLTGPIPPTFSNLKEIESMDLSYNNLNGEIPRQLLELNFLSAFSVAYNNLSGKTPEMVGQFSTFNKSSYEGNPLLCGPPLTNNYIGEISPSPLPRYKTDKNEENSFIDIEAFFVTFSVAYIMVLLAIGAILYINPHWRRSWFYFIGKSINNCYFYLVDNLLVPAKFRRFQPCV
ncbi:receptor-like protein 13 isoform X4 [Populus trichocarpa]|uniref:receptor-like protein 13 isoform X4 n=1 Tax=Populus trichocarpa TaxID=3694 RepID=UPI002279CAA1|nr:receptor-like protein 13 isoform X4 [Populus trichocarpa]